MIFVSVSRGPQFTFQHFSRLTRTTIARRPCFVHDGDPVEPGDQIHDDSWVAPELSHQVWAELHREVRPWQTRPCPRDDERFGALSVNLQGKLPLNAIEKIVQRCHPNIDHAPSDTAPLVSRSSPVFISAIAATVEVGRPQGFQHGGSREDVENHAAECKLRFARSALNPYSVPLRRPPSFLSR